MKFFNAIIWKNKIVVKFFIHHFLSILPYPGRGPVNTKD